MASSIKEMVSQGKTVELVRIEFGTPWYKTECGFEFPIPQEDLNAVFLPKDKAILFMRWIKKHAEAMDSTRMEMITSNTMIEGILYEHSKSVAEIPSVSDLQR